MLSKLLHCYFAVEQLSLLDGTEQNRMTPPPETTAQKCGHALFFKYAVDSKMCKLRVVVWQRMGVFHANVIYIYIYKFTTRGDNFS